MLQQTTVAHASPYFEAFTRRWPTEHPDRAIIPPVPDVEPATLRRIKGRPLGVLGRHVEQR